MKVSAVLHRDEDKMPRTLDIKLGRKKLKIKYLYSPAGDVYGFTVEGRRELLPSVTDIFKIVDAKRLDRIGTIEELTELVTLTTLKTLKVIESIESMPNIVVEGSEGVSFKQAAASAGAWTSPDGFSDPFNQWTTEAKAYDGDLNLGADTAVDPAETTGFLHLTFSSAIQANKLRFYLWHSGTPEDCTIDVDAKINGSWVNVYEGSFTEGAWIEKSFTEGSVDEVRFRFYNGQAAPSVMQVSEVDVWAVPSVGGEMEVIQATAADLNMTEASASAIKTAVEKIDDMISGSEGQVDVVTLPSKSLTYYEIDANATEDVITVGSGETAKVYAFFFYCDADITSELRFKTSGKVIGGLSVEGACGMNMRAADLPPYEGADNEEVEIYLSAAGNVAGWVLAEVS